MLDNLENIEDVDEFIPNIGGDVIVTTRNHVDETWGTVIRVDKMSMDDALLLLLGPGKQSAPPEYAVKIIEELDCMPLAVDIVRAYIFRTKISFKDYLEMYREKNAFLFKHQEKTSTIRYKHTVATVWKLSFDKIGERDSIAGLILGACAFLHPDAIPVSLFRRQSTVLSLLADQGAILTAIGVLVEFSFLQRTTTNVNAGDGNGDGDDDYDPARDLLAIHRLVQAVIRESDSMKNGGQLAWGERLVAAMDKEVVSNDFYNPQVRKINDVYIPHIRHVVNLVDWAKMDTESQFILYDLLSRTSSYLLDAGAFQSGKELALIQVSISEEVHGVEHSDTATSVNNLAGLYEARASTTRPSRCTNGRWRSTRRRWDQSTRTRQRP